MNISAPFIERPIATALLMVALLAAGLVAEFLCRVPPQDDDDDHPDRGPERVHL